MSPGKHHRTGGAAVLERAEESAGGSRRSHRSRQSHRNRQRPSALRRATGVFGELLITGGLLVLLFLAWQMWWTDVEADRAQAKTVAAITEEFTDPPDTRVDPLIEGDVFGVIRIPRLGEDYARPIVEGTQRDTLKEGLGHYTGTAGPGEVGNFALAGHRNTFGKPLAYIDKLQKGDLISVETIKGWSVYAVRSYEIVLPSENRVIAPVPNRPGEVPVERWLTLTACHPRPGNSHRYIVHAQLVSQVPRAMGAPDLAAMKENI